MGLVKKTDRWVSAGIIDLKTSGLILAFEEKWRSARVTLFLNILGIPVLIFGVITAIVVAYQNIGGDLGYALDLTATTTLAVGTFHVIVKKLASKSKGIALSMGNFALGAGLLVAATEIENLSPFRTLLIWASFIVFSTLLAQRLFRWLVGLTIVYMIGLYFVREYFGPNPDFDPYLLVALAMAVLTPVVLFFVWFTHWAFFLWRAFWTSWIIKGLVDFLKSELERLKAAWRLFRIRQRATSIWLGKSRRLILEIVGGIVVGCTLRKHFEMLDAFLWESQSVYTYATLITWLTFLSLLRKERHPFSMWFAFVGSLEIFLHLAQFSLKEPFRLSLASTNYQIGHLTLGVFVLMALSAFAKKFVENKMTASNLFTLGPLGWLTAVGLLSLV